MSTSPELRAYLVASYTVFTFSLRKMFFLCVVMVCVLD